MDKAVTVLGNSDDMKDPNPRKKANRVPMVQKDFLKTTKKATKKKAGGKKKNAKNKQKYKTNCYFCPKRFPTKFEIELHLLTHTKERPALCNFCGKDFVTNSSLTIHIRRHVGEKPYKCKKPGCPYSSSDPSDLKSHTRRVHAKEKNYACPHPNCEKKFFEKRDLKRHSFTHSGDKPHNCNFCGKKFALISALNMHIRRHVKEKPFKCLQSGCSYTSSCPNDVKRHTKRVHGNERNNLCPHPNCGKRFFQKKELKAHSVVHEERFKCSFCGEGFTSKAGRNAHERQKHKERLPLPPINKCYFCPKQFSKNYHMMDHLLTHTKELPFACTICGKEFAKKQTLSMHILRHQKGEKRYKCKSPGCSYASFSGGDVDKHYRRMHLGEKSVPCLDPKCGKMFFWKRDRDLHYRQVHSKEKPFKCNFCLKGFASKQVLDTHIRRHVGEKWFKCKEAGCTYTAVCSTGIRSHTKNKHSEKNKTSKKRKVGNH